MAILTSKNLPEIPAIGTLVRTKVSVFRSPEGSIGRIARFHCERYGPVLVIESSSGEEIPVLARDYPYFFDALDNRN